MVASQPTQSDPTFEDVLGAYVENGLGRQDGSIIVLLENYDAARQIAEVRAAVPVRDRVTGVLLNPIFTVRVAWPRAGSSAGAQLFADTMPLTRGDPMRVMPQDRDHSGWFASGTTGVAPRGKHRSQLVDAVAVPGGASDVDPLPAIAYAADGRVIYGDPFVYLGSSAATEFIALATQVLQELQAIKNHFDVLISSPLTGEIPLHTHIGNFGFPTSPSIAPSATPGPTGYSVAPVPQSVASTAVKSI